MITYVTVPVSSTSIVVCLFSFLVVACLAMCNVIKMKGNKRRSIRRETMNFLLLTATNKTEVYYFAKVPLLSRDLNVIRSRSFKAMLLYI